MPNFINLADINKKDLRKIIERAKKQKKSKKTQSSRFFLKGKTLIMVFEKPSTEAFKASSVLFIFSLSFSFSSLR